MDALFPSLTALQRALLALAAVVVLAVCGKLHFYLPDNPVPITFQTAGVLLMGGFLGLRWGLLAIVVYYLLGMVGAPMFASRELAWDIARGLGAVTGVHGWLPDRFHDGSADNWLHVRARLDPRQEPVDDASGQPVDICARACLAIDLRFRLARAG